MGARLAARQDTEALRWKIPVTGLEPEKLMSPQYSRSVTVTAWVGQIACVFFFHTTSERMHY